LLWFAPGNAARASAPFHLPRENKSLHFLFDKVFEKAVDIVQNSCVKRVVGETSGRELFQVKAKRSSSSRRNRRSTGGEAQQDDYLVLPFHYCSCHAFQYEVINRGEMFLCKHILAARIAKALGMTMTVIVNDVLLAQVLLSY